MGRKIFYFILTFSGLFLLTNKYPYFSIGSFIVLFLLGLYFLFKKKTITSYHLELVILLVLIYIYFIFSYFISNQYFSNLISFGIILFLLYVVDISASIFPSYMQPVLQYLSMGRHFSSISRGIIDSRDIVYYLSVIFFFLFLTGKSLENRKY